MKHHLKRLLLAMVFAAMLPYFADAQVIKAGLVLGGNLSQVDGDRTYGFKRIGLNVGATAVIPFTNHWSLSLETIFSQEGAYQKNSNYTHRYPLPVSGIGDTIKFDADITNHYDLRLNYVRIPVLVHYVDRRLAIGAGFQYGRLVYAKENNRIKPSDTDVVLPEFYELDKFTNKNDLNVLLDIRFRIWKGLYINGRYSYSMLPIRKVNMVFVNTNTNELWEEPLKQYNNTLTLRLIWLFNDGDGTLEKQGKESKRKGV